MGWVGGLAWVNYSKKHCRNLLWRLKAEMKKAVKNGSKQRATFGYDAWSYALNFDDGRCGFRNETDVLRTIQAPDPTSNTWVLVLCEISVDVNFFLDHFDLGLSDTSF